MTVLKMTADVEVAQVGLKEELGSTLDLRDHFVREVQEAEALLARVAARVQKRKATLAKYEAVVLELRTKIHLLGMDRDFGEDLMGRSL